MTTKTDITLPQGITNHGIVGHDGPVYTDVMVRDIIRAAVEAGRQHNSMTIAHAWIRPALNLTEDAPYRFDFYAQKIADLTTDRQSRMPSDEEIDKLSHGFALQYQGHVRNFARALLSRYSSGQPAKPSNSGELGSRPGKSDQCGQPAASAEPPKRPYARSSTLGEYGIIPECDTQPATPASAQATIKDSKIVGETSAQDREDAPSIWNPLTPYGVLVRALRIVAGTTLMEMSEGTGYTPSYLSGIEFGRNPVTDGVIGCTWSFLEDKGIKVPLSVFRKAADRAAKGVDHG